MKETNTTYLQPKTWSSVNQQLIKKAISEFSHELIITPTLVKQQNEWNLYEIHTDNNLFTYQFNAKKLELDHWLIDNSSIKKYDKNLNIVSLDAIYFIAEFKETLGIPDEFLATYLEEITSTLSSAAYKLTYENFSSNKLAEQGFQEIEHAMTEGHPCFVANNGRIGFNHKDYHLYAPETDSPFKILWIAAHKKYATYTAIKGFEYDKLLNSELGEEKILSFNKQLIQLKLNTEDYIFMPVHPWQWNNKIIHVFAADIAKQNIILVGESNDDYSAQQSIRTLFNASDSKKLYTKTALSILNMGFMRGLSPYYMQSTPYITQWINDLLEKDDFLNSINFTMLGEVATVGYHNHYYEILGKTNPHNKMLSALWRESPFTKINKNQKACTMAALLHLDSDNNALLKSLIETSGISTQKWIEKYLNSYFTPLLHCFYKYEFVFMPHGENLILVFENNTPQFVLMKDITEEVIVFNENIVLPEHVNRLYVKGPDNMKTLSIFTDVFDCFFRFLAEILDTKLNFSENQFWKLVAECIYNYQDTFPEFSEKYKRYDFFVDEFDRCCLNRLQLSNTKQMLNLANPIESLKLVGTLKNPIAQFKKTI